MGKRFSLQKVFEVNIMEQVYVCVCVCVCVYVRVCAVCVCIQTCMHVHVRAHTLSSKAVGLLFIASSTMATLKFCRLS